MVFLYLFPVLSEYDGRYNSLCFSMKISQRMYEIDLLRAFAVLCMIIFHIAFDLESLHIYDFVLGEYPWNFMARFAQITFIFLAGMTYMLSYEKHLLSEKGRVIWGQFKHAFLFFGFAMIISLITWILFRDQAVKFGILHFFAVATILTIPLSRLKIWNGVLGILVLVSSLWIPKFDASWWFYPFGVNLQAPTDLDYFPLFPWYGLFLLGVGFASVLIRFWTRHIYTPIFRNAFLEKIGRKSLVIYLLHQPIIWGILHFYLYIQENFFGK